MRVLITGAAGFLARHTNAWLTREQPDLHRIGLDVVRPADAAASWTEFHTVDLADPAALSDTIAAIRPDTVLHLAGLFHTEPQTDIYRVNALGTVNLLEALHTHVPDVTVVATGSAAEYGRPEPDQLPLREDSPRNPVNLYGVSKAAATDAVCYYARQHGLRAMVVRPFQLLGRGLSPRLAPAAFAEQVRSAARAPDPVIQVGNLNSARDFLDADDAAAALWALVCTPAPGAIFNLCTAVPVKLSTILETLLDAASVDARIEVDSQRLRGAQEVDEIFGDNTKLTRHTVWQPRVPLAESLNRMIADD